MRPEQIILVQTCYASIVPNAESVVADFYRRLFELDPALRPLFHTDMKAQTHKFVTMLDLLVGDLTQLDRLLPAIELLGIRHVENGATAAHYREVRQALLAALEHELKELWSPELQAAWASAYNLVATMMQAAAAPAPELTA